MSQQPAPNFQKNGEGVSAMAFLRLGFRPFYLGAAALACVEIPLWVATYLGGVTLPLTLPALLWHAHEMLFGFAVAVIVGFLLTAGKAWTGRATPRGAVLGALAALWLAARLASFGAPGIAYAILDLALLPVVAGILADVLLRAGSHRNLPLVGLLLLLAGANAVFHLATLGVVDAPPERPLYAALGLIVLIESVMAGRVVPAFTMSATPGLRLNVRTRLDTATLAATGLALLLWVAVPPGWPGAISLAVAALLHLLRQAGWRPWVTRGRPILWILHAAYAWIPVGLALLAFAQIGVVSASAGVHALAVGATGGLIVGMITRTARGHTGRPLVASRAEVTAYALVMVAAAVRVFVPIAVPEWIASVLIVAAIAWSGAFCLYLVRFAPWLASTRLDGKDG